MNGRDDWRVGCVVLAALFLAVGSGPGRAQVRIVAAENFYGDVARQIGGDRVIVTSILTHPDQDPHLFTANVDTAKAVADAQIVIYSGIDYDPWMEQMNAAHPGSQRVTINVSKLIHAAAGDNPHIWYGPSTMPALARSLAALLAARDPAHAAAFRSNLTAFLAGLQPIAVRIAALRAKYAGADVLATEPVFGYMSDALGFRMHAMEFQNHVMNNVEPTARESEEFETLLKTHRVKILFYNGQATDPVATRMQAIAQASGVPVIGVTETEPPGITYAPWMLSQLAAVEKALAPR